MRISDWSSDVCSSDLLFSSTESRSSNNPVSASSTTPPPQPDLTSLGLAPQPATPSAQDRQLAFLNQAPDKRTVSPDRVAVPASPNVLQEIGRASCRESVCKSV